MSTNAGNLNRRAIHAAARWLRREFPPLMPVWVSLRPTPGTFGYTEAHPEYLRVVIDPASSLAVQLDTLLHEWAHCCVGWIDQEHSDQWARAYGRIYRAWMEKEG